MHPDNTIPKGFCQCGCGQRTPIAIKTRSHLGHIKGEPVRYIRGHSGTLPKPNRKLPEHIELRPMIDRGDGVTLIPLLDGTVALIDSADAEKVKTINWALSSSTPDKQYVRGRQPRTNSPVYLHRLILDAQPGETIDHVNGDTCDNRRQNLRKASHQQNTFNRSTSRNNTSGFKGVSRVSWRDGWRATIRHDGKQLFLGVFDSPEDAAQAYDAKAHEIHGEFAQLNFPDRHD